MKEKTISILVNNFYFVLRVQQRLNGIEAINLNQIGQGQTSNSMQMTLNKILSNLH